MKDQYPKLTWDKDISIHSNGVIIKSRNVRQVIIDKEINGERGYLIRTLQLDKAEFPDLQHPLIHCMKVRATKWGNLYETLRLVKREHYNKSVYGMDWYLSDKVITWTHNGKTEEE